MKSAHAIDPCRLVPVTPLAGVWIEIMLSGLPPPKFQVTPLAGVWIEIMRTLPGTKAPVVTPLAGVWIEITYSEPPSAICL